MFYIGSALLYQCGRSYRFHVIPVCDYPSLNRSLHLKGVYPKQSFLPDVRILLCSVLEMYQIGWYSDRIRKLDSWFGVAGKTSFAHPRASVNDDGTILVTHDWVQQRLKNFEKIFYGAGQLDVSCPDYSCVRVWVRDYNFHKGSPNTQLLGSAVSSPINPRN